jgi:hypothetical protein
MVQFARDTLNVIKVALGTLALAAVVAGVALAIWQGCQALLAH